MRIVFVEVLGKRARSMTPNPGMELTKGFPKNIITVKDLAARRARVNPIESVKRSRRRRGVFGKGIGSAFRDAASDSRISGI
jgi:hypothetical protein